ncbi:MAG TPA: DNA-binding response regulator, partial [Parafilimonas sp.]|nr:DNA-binding response regulator [Parafilimonas sp.]
MIKVLILEDEDAASTRLKKMVAEILPEAEFLAIIPGVKQGLEWFATNKHPDLIFADIQLNDGTSFDIFMQVETESPVIFTTAYDAYALNAFKLNSIDY